MWCAGSSAAASKSSARRLVGCLPALVIRIEEPVAEELELELIEAVLVEDRPQLAERLRLEHVLEVGMPDADAPEPDALRPARSARGS